jgi:aryl-alcohol dehydrogenase-like predicted oxidoreductase
MSTTRREFLKVGAGAVAGTSAVSSSSKEVPSFTASEDRTVASAGGAGNMIYRIFGSTDARISAIGVGGHHLGDVTTLDEAVQLVHEAIDAGVTFFDNAWEYYNGKTETILGRALRGFRRDKVFLMTKVCTHGRSGKLAMQMLEDSLRRYQTDHLDLWQIHGIVYDNDPELAYAKGGVLEAFDQAKKEGKVRFVGFTGHKDPAFHLTRLSVRLGTDAAKSLRRELLQL